MAGTVRIKLNTSKYNDKYFRGKYRSGRNVSVKLNGPRAR